MKLIEEKGVNHGFNDRLAVALRALLIVSILLDITTLIIAILSDSAFGMWVFLPAFIDENNPSGVFGHLHRHPES
jgi:hypothetical protein